MSETFEPLRQNRWQFECDGIPSFTLRSLELRRQTNGTYSIFIRRMLCEDEDVVTRLCVWAGILKFLDAGGQVVQALRIQWGSVRTLPICRLDYTSSEPVQQEIELCDAHLARLED